MLGHVLGPRVSDKCLDTCVDMCMHTYVDMCLDMSMDMCIDMRLDACLGMCIFGVDRDSAASPGLCLVMRLDSRLR